MPQGFTALPTTGTLTGLQCVQDINTNDAAVQTLNSGPAAPSTTFAYMWWADTTNNLLKQRNSGDSAWVVRGSLAETFVLARSSNTIIGVADFGRSFVCTSTFSQTLTAAATLGDGFWFIIRNNGVGVITIDPNASETINGATTLALNAGAAALVVCDGVSFYTLGAGTLSVSNGGTGATTLTNHGVVIGQGTSAVAVTAAGATNTVLHGNTGADPSYSAVVEADITLADNTTNNVSTSAHGFAPKAPNDARKFLSGLGTYTIATNPIGSQIFTSNGTFTIPANTNSGTVFKCTLIGGGAGGGGSVGPGAGGGGGAGGTCIKYYTGWTAGNTVSITIGGAGGGGNTAGSAGANGGNTTITSGTQSITFTQASAGSGGGGGITSAGAGGGGGTSTNGDIVLTGASGANGFTDAATFAMGGSGGYSTLGAGGRSSVEATGQTALGYGGGGAGGASVGANKSGGGGVAGLVLIEWTL